MATAFYYCREEENLMTPNVSIAKDILGKELAPMEGEEKHVWTFHLVYTPA